MVVKMSENKTDHTQVEVDIGKARSPYSAVTPIILGMGFIQGGYGLLTTIQPGLLAQAGYDSNAIGISTALGGAGFMLGTILSPRLLHKIGHIRSFAVLAAVNGLGSLALGTYVDIALWTAMRAMMMAGLAGLYTLCESWIASLTQPSNRGQVLGFYILAYKLALLGIPLVIPFMAWLNFKGEETASDASSSHYYLIMTAFFIASLIPIALTNTPPPLQAQKSEKLGLKEIKDFWLLAPTTFMAALLGGMSNSAVSNLITLYAHANHYSLNVGIIMFSALQSGNLLFQWPCGRLSDKRDRRKVVMVLAAATALVSLLTALIAGHVDPFWVYPLLILWGGFGMSIYSISLAHACDRSEEGQMVKVSAMMLLVWGVGMIIGPIWAGAMMEWLGPWALFANSALMMGLLALFVFQRMQLRAPTMQAQKNPFVAVPASSPMIEELDPRLPPTEPNPSNSTLR